MLWLPPRPVQDETLRQSFLTATLTLVGAISRTEGAHSYEFSQTSELIECLKVPAGATQGRGSSGTLAPRQHRASQDGTGCHGHAALAISKASPVQCVSPVLAWLSRSPPWSRLPGPT